MGSKGPHQAGRVRVAASDATTGARSSGWSELVLRRRGRPVKRDRASAAPRGESPPISGASDPAGQSRAEARRRARDPRKTGSGRSSVSMWVMHGPQAGRRSQERNPTAVQSGNRSATPLGERPRGRTRGQPSVRANPQGAARAERAEAGPGREQLASSIGPRPEVGERHRWTSRPQTARRKPMEPTDRPTR